MTPPPTEPPDVDDDDRSDDTIVALPVFLPEVPGARPYSRDELLQLLDQHAQRLAQEISDAALTFGRASEALDQAVRAGRNAGITWQEVANRVGGISRQAAQQRWGR